MRTKTERKRNEILASATEVFLALGFDGTAVSQICERAACSKGTLYRYFTSKEELFFEVISQMSASETQPMFSELAAVRVDFCGQLLDFGIKFLKSAYSPRFQAMRRLVFSPSENHGVSRTVYRRTVQPYLERTAAFFEEAITAGKLKQEDTTSMAWHLCGLLESELMLKFLLHALPDLTDADLEAHAERAVSAFIAAYGVP